MDSERIELFTPYQLLRNAANRIMAIRPDQVNIFFEHIASDLEQIQFHLICFGKVDLQITEAEFNNLIYDISRCYSRFAPIWPTPFVVFIYFQMCGRGKDFEEFLEYTKAVVSSNQKHNTDWVVAHNRSSYSIVVYDRANREAAKFVESSLINSPDTGMKIPDDFLDRLNRHND